MNLQVGIEYKTRAGQKVTIVRGTPDQNGFTFVGAIHDKDEPWGASYRSDGTFSLNGEPHAHDIVARWPYLSLVET